MKTQIILEHMVKLIICVSFLGNLAVRRESYPDFTSTNYATVVKTTRFMSNEHNTLANPWINVGPPSETLSQHDLMYHDNSVTVKELLKMLELVLDPTRPVQDRYRRRNLSLIHH